MKTPVRLSRQSLADRDRLFEFLTEGSLAAAERGMSALAQAFEDIADFPKVGRAGPHGYRKLIVRFGKAGYESAIASIRIASSSRASSTPAKTDDAPSSLMKADQGWGGVHASVARR